jgi:type II secretory pathway component PulM
MESTSESWDQDDIISVRIDFHLGKIQVKYCGISFEQFFCWHILKSNHLRISVDDVGWCCSIIHTLFTSK